MLELTEAMQAPAAPAFRKIDAQQDVVFDETPASQTRRLRRAWPSRRARRRSRRRSGGG